jgi:hypothetical protein
MINLEKFQAAPGSYNVSQDLSTRSQVFNNPPRPVIPKGKKYPSMFISNELAKEYQGFDSPPVSKYSPNATVLFKSSSMPKFGGEQRKDYFLMGRDRSPGPIYLYTERNKRACSFGIGEKGSTINQPSHSSGNYEPQSINKRLPIKMKGYVSDKLYLKNLENTYKGKLGPGPAMYKNSGSFTRGVRLPKAIRLQPCKT